MKYFRSKTKIDNDYYVCGDKQVEISSGIMIWVWYSSLIYYFVPILNIFALKHLEVLVS